MKYNQLSSDEFYVYNKQEWLLIDFKPSTCPQVYL